MAKAQKKAKRQENKAKRQAKRRAKGGSLFRRVTRAVNRFNPATVTIRNGILASMKLNISKIAERLRFALITDLQARQLKVNPAKLAKVRKAYQKLKTTFLDMGGKEANLKAAILKGKGNVNPRLGDLGELGVAAETAIAAASTIIAAIAATIKDIKSSKDMYSNSPVTPYEEEGGDYEE